MLALFEDGTTARGDFLVGADGVHSRVRQVIFPSAPAASHGAPQMRPHKEAKGFGPRAIRYARS